jgi:hypothetical protein
MRRRRPLDFFIIAGTAAVTIFAIALGAGRRYLESRSSPGLIVLESLEPLALGAGLGLLCSMLLRRSVLRPLARIHLHLHDVGLGRLKPLPLRSEVVEVQSLIEGVNLMVRRLAEEAGGEGAYRIQESLESLREVARTIAFDSPEGAAEVLRDVDELEKAFVAEARTRSMSPIHIRTVNEEEECHAATK